MKKSFSSHVIIGDTLKSYTFDGVILLAPTVVKTVASVVMIAEVITVIEQQRQ
jgi:hypothetical protein